MSKPKHNRKFQRNKTLFYCSLQPAYLKLSWSAGFLRVELVGSWYKYTKNHYPSTSTDQILEEVLDFVRQKTGTPLDVKGFSTPTATKILQALKNKQLTLF